MSKFDQFTGKDIKPENVAHIPGRDPIDDMIRQINVLTHEIRRTSQQQTSSINRLETMNGRLQQMIAERQMPIHRPQIINVPTQQVAQQENSNVNTVPVSRVHAATAPVVSTAIRAITPPPKTSWTMGELIDMCRESPNSSQIVLEDRNGDWRIIREIRNHGDLHTQGHDPILLGLMKRLPTDVRLRIVHRETVFERFTVSLNSVRDTIILKLT